MHIVEEHCWLYYNNCYKIAKKILKCHDQASDVASESIYRVLSALKSENPPQIDKNPIPYINEIVFNICKNIKRKDKNTIPLDEIEYDKTYVLDFELFDLQNVIKKYPNEVNKLITMKVQGYSTKECADEFNTNENSLKVRWHRIKNKLKAEFE